LRTEGLSLGRYRIRKLMRELTLTVRLWRKRIHTTDSGHDLEMVYNVLERKFKPDAPNCAWICDITYVST